MNIWTTAKNAILAIAETTWEYKTIIFRQVVGKVARRKIVALLPKPDGSPWLLERISQLARQQYLVKEELNSVNDKVANMPPEFKGHIQVDRILVHHDAFRAGPHLESYIVINGQAYNIGLKRLSLEMQAPIRLNSEGHLTAQAQRYLIGLWRTEIERNGFLAQSTDHLPGEARAEWWNGTHSSGYGAGNLRQVLLDSKVDLFSSRQGDPTVIELRDWDLNPHRDMYIFKIFGSRDGKNSSILSLGFKRPRAPALKDRLHLTPDIGEEAFPKFQRLVGEDGIVTIKEDGASFYFDVNRKGARFWSPRISKRTGDRIDYTAKLRDLRHISTKIPIRGMGELLFVDRKTSQTLKAHEIGGLLNAHSSLPEQYLPKLVIYRVDKVDRSLVIQEPYSDNLDRINRFIKEVDHPFVESPRTVEWQSALSKALSGEGLVGVAAGKSIIDGRKFKPRGETQDGIITDIQFLLGEKGGIAGGIHYIDDHTGKPYIISSGFTLEQKMAMMQQPREYIGRCMVLSHYQGHHGRAAKFQRWHLDKGTR